MSNLIPLTPNECFDIAEKIAGSPLIPDAYRGKPRESGIAILYGNEVGLPPMTSLQRIVVINGKPTLDAQSMTALIRAAGHSLTGDATDVEATATGKRQDTGDVMSVTYTIDDAKRAGLIRNGGPWTKFPKSMLWARAVSQLARELFGDVLLGISYVPEEMQAVVDDSKPKDWVDRELTAQVVEEHPASSSVREPPAALQAVPDVVEETGEIIDVEPTDDQRELVELKTGLGQIINETGNALKLKGELIERFGPASDLDIDGVREAIAFAAGWMDTPEESGEEDHLPF